MESNLKSTIESLKGYVRPIEKIQGDFPMASNIFYLHNAASSMIDQKFPHTPKQEAFLEDILDTFDNYAETGRQIEDRYNNKIVELYLQTHAVMKACTHRDKKIGAIQGDMTQKIKYFERMKGKKARYLSYPSLINQVISSLDYLQKSKGMKTQDLLDDAISLKNEYWEIYNSLKTGK